MSKITLDSGRSVEVQDEATAALVSDYIDRLQKQITDAATAADKQQATIDTQVEQIKTLQAATADNPAAKTGIASAAAGTTSATAIALSGAKFLETTTGAGIAAVSLVIGG